jgi:hypothetical protein
MRKEILHAMIDFSTGSISGFRDTLIAKPSDLQSLTDLTVRIELWAADPLQIELEGELLIEL